MFALQVELDSAQFVTRTYVTTYTLVETSSETSTSKEHVVSNVATEQLSPAGATSTPLSSGQYERLLVGGLALRIHVALEWLHVLATRRT